LKKRETPPTIKKSHSTTNATGEKYRHLEDDVVTLGHMNDLAKTITVPHQVKYFEMILKKCVFFLFSSWMNQLKKHFIQLINI
jgi:hypothetical protein